MDESALEFIRIFNETFNSYRNAGIGTDLNLQCCNKIFKVHKYILAASSPYFDNMLRSDFAVTKSNYLEIPDISETVMEAILNSIYLSDKPELHNASFEFVVEMFVAVDMLRIQNLIDYLWDKLMDLMNDENCLQILKMQRVHAINDGDEVIDYVMSRLSTIRENSKMADLDFDTLLLLLHKAKSKVESHLLLEIVIFWIKSDEVERKCYLLTLLDEIDLASLKPEHLENFMSEALICNEKDALEKLMHATYIEPKDDSSDSE